MSKEALEILEAVEWALNGACYICKGLEPRHFSNCALKQAIILLKQQPKALDFAINCGAMGKGDDSCCGCIYWSVDGKLLCNECGTEYHLVEQQPPGEWTKKLRNFIKLYENEVPRRAEITFLIEACDRLDRAESIKADLLAACKEFMLIADNGSAAFDDPLPDSPYLKAKAAIAKAEQVGE